MDSADTAKIKERIIDILDKLFSDVGIDKDSETSTDTKMAAAALDKKNNGHCNKT